MKKLTKKAIIARIEEIEGSDNRLGIQVGEAKAWAGLSASFVIARAEEDYGWTAETWAASEPKESLEELAAEPTQKKAKKPPKRARKNVKPGKSKWPDPMFIPELIEEKKPTAKASETVPAEPVKEDVTKETDKPVEPVASQPEAWKFEPWDEAKPFPLMARVKQVCLDELYRTRGELIKVVEYSTDGAERKLNRWIGDVQRCSPGGLIAEERRRDGDPKGEREYRFRMAKNPELAAVRVVVMVPEELAPLVAALPGHSKAKEDLLALVAKYS